MLSLKLVLIGSRVSPDLVLKTGAVDSQQGINGRRKATYKSASIFSSAATFRFPMIAVLFRVVARKRYRRKVQKMEENFTTFLVGLSYRLGGVAAASLCGRIH